MTSSPVPLSSSAAVPIKRKRVLLVDASRAKSELRSDAMRKLGIDVDCACDIVEARSWWRADLYTLVLINLESNPSHWEDFCSDIRVATPPQKLAFLVGKPAYLSDYPPIPDPRQAENPDIEVGTDEAITGAIGGFASSALQWGIMEASRQISAVRSASAARSLAIRNRPAERRPQEQKVSRSSEVRSRLVIEQVREELQ